MKRNDTNIDKMLKRYLPSASREDTVAAQRRAFAQLREEVAELKEELEARRETGAAERVWPGELEPLVLAAAFLLRGKGDAGLITGLANELAAKTVKITAVRFTLHRLVRRGLVREVERKFTVTPDGERALAQAKATAKRWIDALGDWGTPSSTG